MKESESLFFTRTEEQKQLLATFRAGGLNEHLQHS